MEETLNESEKTEESVVVTKKKCQWLKKDALSSDALLIAGALLVGAILIASSYWIPMKSDKIQGGANAKPAQQADDKMAKEAESGPVTVSLDDDPVMGDKKKAKVAIIEFSDLECPFCKRFHQETYDQLVKEYVETGKAVIVARDFPLSFHDPKATEEAAVAECVRDQKGDAAYFSFTKAVYGATQANGKGLPQGKMMELLKAAGVDTTKALACSEEASTKEEIAKDIADGTKAGITGTPSFVIGTLAEDGTVTGEVVVGALPLAGFQEAINKYSK
ncbi:MAG: DsbA family protein [Candidatus Moranbacteria bacterium]|nr:DsbA family protein [Candidatus Moranbacteria bacterium]